MPQGTWAIQNQGCLSLDSSFPREFYRMDEKGGSAARQSHCNKVQEQGKNWHHFLPSRRRLLVAVFLSGQQPEGTFTGMKKTAKMNRRPLGEKLIRFPPCFLLWWNETDGRQCTWFDEVCKSFHSSLRFSLIWNWCTKSIQHHFHPRLHAKEIQHGTNVRTKFDGVLNDGNRWP